MPDLTHDDKLHCALCGGTVFRRSRWTLHDIPRLLFLELPVRCQDCGERSNVLFSKAMPAIKASARARSRINQQDN